MTQTAFPYPGGKAKYAEWIISSLPKHSAYVEVFGGAAAVLMNKAPSEVEVYNDIDGDIPHFFRTLRDDGEELQEYLRNVEFSLELYKQWTRRWYEGWRPKDDIKRAAIFYFSRYAQWGGKYEGISGFARSAAGRGKAESFASQVESIHEFQERLNETAPGWPEEFKDFRNRNRGVLIDNLDYRDIFDKYDRDNSDGDGTVFYCDPPYVDTEHRYSGDGFNHEALVEALHGLEGDWILSYGADLPDGLESFRTEQRSATRGIDRVGHRPEEVDMVDGYVVEEEGEVSARDPKKGGKEATEQLVKSYPASKERSFEIGGTSGDATTEDW